MLQVQFPIRSIADLIPGDHLCCIYDTDEEHRNIITPFLRKGLEQNEKVVYIVDARDPQTIINYLKTDDVDIEHYQKKGQFSILTSTDTYLKRGIFDPDRMIVLLTSETQKALDEGYCALRFTGEMSWAIRGLPGSERLIEYESKLNNFFPGSRCLAICQYDRRRFDAGILLNILITHPFAFISANLYDNFYYTPPEDILKPNRSEITLDRWIKNIKDRKAKEEVLRESEEQFRNLFQNAVEGILVADVDTRKFLLANPAICRMLGYTEKELTSMRIGDIHPEKELNYIVKEFGSIMQGNKHFSDSIPCLRKDGSILYADISGFPQIIDGKKCNIGFFTDVTERKRAEEALRESQQRFQALTETTSDFVWEMDANGVYTYCSPQINELWGYKPEDMRGRSPFDLMIPEDRKHGIKMFRTLSESPSSFKGMETNSLDNTGRIVVLETSGVPFFDIDGRLRGYRGISRDITERKKAEEALRQSEETFRALAENANDGILVAVIGGAHSYANRRASEITGYSIAELLKTSIKDLAAPGELEKVTERLRKILLGDPVPPQYETTIISKDRKRVPIEVTSAKTFWHGQPADLVILRDITERKRAEETLQDFNKKLQQGIEEKTATLHENELRQRMLFESSRDAIMTLEPPDWRFTSGNPATITMFRAKDEAEFTSAAPWELSPECQPDGRPSGEKAKEMIEKAVQEGFHYFEWTHKRLNGEEFPATVLLTRFEWKEKKILQATVRDITEQKHAEDKIKASLDEKVLLLREIHHRVRNNLQIILSLIRLQSRNIKDPHLLDTMGDFKNRIMAMAHIHERMCHADDISRIDLSEIVTFLGTSLFKSYKVDPQHIRLNVEMKDLQITIDSAIPISLIINELVSNSIKHAFPKGTPGEITIAGYREADTLVLSIRDTGIGIPKDFDWMSSNQSIGHRLVVSLVEQLNGTVELDRTTGTAFNIVVHEK
jgi:PAS domain S-box-containing protein